MLRKLNAERNINPNFKFSLVNPLPVNKMSCVTDLERKVQLVPNLPVPTDDMETDSSSPILHRQKVPKLGGGVWRVVTISKSSVIIDSF